ncbi:MAG: exodeoxyribonuclease III [Burkholderiales bacterium]|jgi:exodeoxyribonuclease-3|nr:exodeoxyribonuclease III [Burkholderiales bacterium]
MKIISWNVNSLNVRLPRVLALLERHAPDVVCLQEIKAETARFPTEVFESAGYKAECHGQKTYNGVALLVKSPAAPTDVLRGIPDGDEDFQARVIAATVLGVRVFSVYVPNGQEVGSDKYGYKLSWLRRFTRYLIESHKHYERIIVAGDFNIVPDDRDIWDAHAWRGKILCSDDERAAYRAVLSTGLSDSFRLFDQPAGVYSWWDYRQLGFQKNHGMRLDHILLSSSLADQCVSSGIDRDERKGEKPSDHAPAVAEITGV